MLSLIQTEFLKLKRKTAILVALFSSLLPPLINTLYTLYLHDNNTMINATFGEFYQTGLSFVQWILLPCVLGAMGAMLFFNERENGTLKDLMIVPVNKTLFFFAKLTVLFIFSVLFMLITVLFTIMGALAIGYGDMAWAEMVRLLELGIKIGLLTVLSMLPILFIAVISDKGYILPACATLIYALSAAILSSHLAGIHPLSSTAAVIWQQGAESGALMATPTMGMINITTAAALFIMASIYALKKKSY